MDYNKLIMVSGKLLGERLEHGTDQVIAEVVHIMKEQRPEGPALNAFIFVELSPAGNIGRYISWINYYDLEDALSKEHGCWRLIEPSQEYSREINWMPYGWPDSIKIPSVGFYVGNFN